MLRFFKFTQFNKSVSKLIMRIRAFVKALVRGVLFIGVPLAVVSGAIYIVFFSRTFVIDYVDISGVKDIDTAKVREILFNQMEQKVAWVIPQNNILFFDIGSTKKAIWDAYALEDVVITKQYPKTLSVVINQQPLSAFWFTGTNWFSLDPKATAARQVDPQVIAHIPPDFLKKDNQQPAPNSKPSQPGGKGEAFNGVLFFWDESSSNIAIGDEVMLPSVLLHTQELVQKFNEHDIPISYIKIQKGTIPVTLITNEGWKILANPLDDLDEEVKAVSTLLTSRVKDQKKNLDYIDVRFFKRAYLKFK